jgi:hypothetical protein
MFLGGDLRPVAEMERICFGRESAEMAALITECHDRGSWWARSGFSIMPALFAVARQRTLFSLPESVRAQIRRSRIAVPKKPDW